MSELLHEIAQRQTLRDPSATALIHKAASVDYGALGAGMQSFAAALLGLGCERRDRVAIFLPKQFENVYIGAKKLAVLGESA